MVAGKKTKSTKKAIKEQKELKQKVKDKKEKDELKATELGLFRKKLVDKDTTVYYGPTKSYMHSKKDESGFGGAKISLRLEDGSIEEVKGAFFCPQKLAESIVNKK